MSDQPKTCGTCKHSRWDGLTPTGRIGTNTRGECVVELPELRLPYCVTRAFGFPRNGFNRTCISKDSGEDCPLYEPNEGGLIPL